MRWPLISACRDSDVRVTTVSDQSGIQVLLVEDDGRVAALRGALLERLGGEVTTATTLAEARELLLKAAAPIDVLVTDINLGPGADDQSGLEIAREVRRRWGDVPIVAYSAVFSTDDLDPADLEAVDRVLVKGDLGLADLADALADVIDLGRKARDARQT